VLCSLLDYTVLPGKNQASHTPRVLFEGIGRYICRISVLPLKMANPPPQSRLSLAGLLLIGIGLCLCCVLPRCEKGYDQSTDTCGRSQGRASNFVALAPGAGNLP
jgi:hypothetical protein